MKIVEIRPAQGARGTWIAVVVAVGLSLSLAATTALAQPTGIVQIKGKRYVDGEESKVKCSKTEGNMLDATTLGTRVFTLANTPDCAIFTDTPGDGGVLTFTGLEDMIAKNTIVKARYIFSGVETGGLVAGAAQGILQGKSEMARSTFLKEKGTITYSYENEFLQNVIFVGKYVAKF